MQHTHTSADALPLTHAQAYATDLAKDGALAFAFKLSGHKHTFEAQSAAERDGWFVAVEKAITEAKASKDTIESSEGYKEAKDKIGTCDELCHRFLRDAMALVGDLAV